MFSNSSLFSSLHKKIPDIIRLFIYSSIYNSIRDIMHDVSITAKNVVLVEVR